jgi:SWI/SNF-related matrix-associated actin-dependent regulator 1 of chromatin subfamily A
MKLKLPTGDETCLPSPSFTLSWYDQGEVNTRQGPRHLFSAEMPEGWWDYWNAHKDDLKATGFSCGKDQKDRWQITCWMLPASGANKSDFSHELLAMSRADKASDGFELDLPADVTPYPYQVAGVQYALTRKRVIIGDDMGLGKSLQAIATCNHVKATNILVVCPASLRLNWSDEFAKFSTHPNIKECVVLSKDDIPAIADANVVFISYNLMTKEAGQEALRARQWECLIADEAHFLKGAKDKRSTHLLGLPPRSRPPKGTVHPNDPIPSDRYMFLTGTPVSNRPKDFWNLLRFCAPEHFGVFVKYGLRYCDGKKGFGNSLDTSGASNLNELQTLVRGSCMVRRLKTQVLTQLPAKTRKIIALPASKEIIRKLNALTLEYTTSEETIADMKRRVEAAKTAEDSEAMEIAIASLREAKAVQFTETSKVRKEIGLSKVDLAIDHIVNALNDSSNKVIVGAHHKEVVEALQAGLQQFNPAMVTGDASAIKRHEAVHRFQTDPACRVFVGNILAAGVGLTLTAAPHVIIVEPSWVPADNVQFEDRVHRIGQLQPVLVEYLAMEETLDIQVLRTNARKMAVIDEATDKVSDVELNADEINYGPKAPTIPNKSKDEKIAIDLDQRTKTMAMMALGKSLTPRQATAAHACVRLVAKQDKDGATQRNDVGFNQFDSQSGNMIAGKKLQHLTDFELGRAAKLAWKYRKQSTDRLVFQLKKVTK